MSELKDILGGTPNGLEPRVTALENAQAAGIIITASWTGLQGITPASDNAGAEVGTGDTGYHYDATATGYDGALVPNSGRYSWNASWSRWDRIGPAAVTALTAQLDEHEADETNPHNTTKDQVGLGNVENLAPADMPVSDAVQQELLTKADKQSPVFNGTPFSTTPPDTSNNSDRIATTAFVHMVEAEILTTAATKAALGTEVSRAQLAEEALGTLIATEQARLDAEPTRWADRPGENPEAFSLTVVGDGDNKTSLPSANVSTYTGVGRAYVLAGAGDVSVRHATPLMRDVIEAKYRVKRVVDPIDPNNHRVEFRVAWLNSGMGLISSQVLGYNDNLITGSGDANGVYEFSARVSKDSLEGTSTAPAAAAYAVFYVRTYGSDGSTAIVSIRVRDVTTLHGLQSYDLDQLITDTEAARDAANAAAALVNTETLDTFASVTSYTPPAGTGTIALRGGYAVDDGFGGQWVLNASDTTSAHNPPAVLVDAAGNRYNPAKKTSIPITSVAALLSFSGSVSEGWPVDAEGNRYTATAPAEAAPDLTLPGGAKLWVEREAGGLRAEAFGCDPTGAVPIDEVDALGTTPLNRAITSARARGWRRVVFGPGDFALVNGVELRGDPSISGASMRFELCGAADETTRFFTRGAPDYAFKVNARYFRLRNIKVSGSQDSIRDSEHSPTVAAIWLENMREGALEDFKIEHVVGTGLRIDRCIVSRVKGIVYRCGSDTAPAIDQTVSDQDGFQASWMEINCEDCHGAAGGAVFRSHYNSHIKLKFENQPYHIIEVSGHTGTAAKEQGVTFSGGATAETVFVASTGANNSRVQLVVHQVDEGGGPLNVGDTFVTDDGMTGTVAAFTLPNGPQFQSSGKYGVLDLFLNQNELHDGTDCILSAANAHTLVTNLAMRGVHKGVALQVTGSDYFFSRMFMSLGLTDVADEGDYSYAMEITARNNHINDYYSENAKGIHIDEFARRCTIDQFVQENLYGQSAHVEADDFLIRAVDIGHATYVDPGLGYGSLFDLDGDNVRIATEGGRINAAQLPATHNVLSIAGANTYVGPAKVESAGASNIAVFTSGLQPVIDGLRLTLPAGGTGMRINSANARIKAPVIAGGATSIIMLAAGISLVGGILSGYTTRAVYAAPGAVAAGFHIEGVTCENPGVGATNDIQLSTNTRHARVIGCNLLNGTGIITDSGKWNAVVRHFKRYNSRADLFASDEPARTNGTVWETLDGRAFVEDGATGTPHMLNQAGVGLVVIRESWDALDFGVLPDGALDGSSGTDNSTALLRMMAAISNERDKRFTFPRGVMLCETILLADNDVNENLVIEGYGARIGFLNLPAALNQRFLSFRNTGAQGGRRIALRGLEVDLVDRNPVRTGGCDAVTIGGYNDISVRDLVIPSADNMGLSINRTGTPYIFPDRIEVVGCKIGGKPIVTALDPGTDYHGSIGDTPIWILHYGLHTLVRGNVVRSCGDDAIALAETQNPDNVSTATLMDNHVWGCQGTAYKSGATWTHAMGNVAELTLNDMYRIMDLSTYGGGDGCYPLGGSIIGGYGKELGKADATALGVNALITGSHDVGVHFENAAGNFLIDGLKVDGVGSDLIKITPNERAFDGLEVRNVQYDGQLAEGGAVFRKDAGATYPVTNIQFKGNTIKRHNSVLCRWEANLASGSEGKLFWGDNKVEDCDLSGAGGIYAYDLNGGAGANTESMVFDGDRWDRVVPPTANIISIDAVPRTEVVCGFYRDGLRVDIPIRDGYLFTTNNAGCLAEGKKFISERSVNGQAGASANDRILVRLPADQSWEIFVLGTDTVAGRAGMRYRAHWSNAYIGHADPIAAVWVEADATGGVSNAMEIVFDTTTNIFAAGDIVVRAKGTWTASCAARCEATAKDDGLRTPSRIV